MLSKTAPMICLLACLFSLAGKTPAAASIESSGQSSVTMVSDAQDYIGQGQDRIFYTGNGSVSVSGDASFLTVSVSGGNVGDY